MNRLHGTAKSDLPGDRKTRLARLAGFIGMIMW